MHTYYDFTILAKTIYGEARGENVPAMLGIAEGLAGMYAVGEVILNRSVKRRKTVAEICLQPMQFSCWNGKGNHLYNDREFNANFDTVNMAASNLLLGKIRKILPPGTDHYHTLQINPYWTGGKKPCITIGNHHFYNDIN